MSSKKILNNALFFGSLLFAFASFAEVTSTMYQPEWLVLGSTNVISTSESVTIKLNSELKDKVFRKIRLKVADGSLKVREVKIYMSDGHVVKSGIQKVIKNGMMTRELIIPDHRRSIKKIVIMFKAPLAQGVVIMAVGKERLEEYSES